MATWKAAIQAGLKGMLAEWLSGVDGDGVATTFAPPVTVTPGTGATSLGKAEDAAAASGDTGVMLLGVRADTAAATAANGDYVPLLTDGSGRLWANVNTLSPGTAAANLGKAEDGAHTSADTGVAVLAVRRDTAAVGSDADGDYSTLNVDSAGRLYTSSKVDTALPAGTNNIGDVDVLTIAAGDNNIGNVDVVTLPALATGTNTIGRVQNLVTRFISVTPVLLNADAYDSGDVLFDTTEVTAAFAANDGTGLIQTITVLDGDDQAAAAMTLFIMTTSTSLGTKDSTPSISDANAQAILHIIPIASGDWTDVGGGKIVSLKNLALPIHAGSGVDDFWIAATTGGTPTQTTSGIIIKISILPD